MFESTSYSSHLKINRANKHFADFSAEVAVFQDQNPYRIITDEDTEPAIKIYRVDMLEAVPKHWSAFIGDIIHNTRSSLDCLATSLVIKAGHTSNSSLEEAYFPIGPSLNSLSDNRAKGFFKFSGGHGGPVEKLVRRIEPYKGGKGHALWMLNKLDILDKHRSIIPTITTLKSMSITYRGQPSDLGTAAFRQPMKTGDEFFRAAFSESHFNAKPEAAFHIAFGKTGVAEGDPILPTLRQLIDFTESVIDIFDRNIFNA